MKIKTFLTMPYQLKGLFFINFVLCGIARASINLFGYRRISFYYGYFCRMHTQSTIISKEQLQQAVMIRRAIQLAARYTPWNSSCLTQAMVAKFWCQWYDIPYMLFIGFAKVSDKPLGHDAHAWITAGPVAITGGHSFNTHAVVLSYTNINQKGLHHERN